MVDKEPIQVVGVNVTDVRELAEGVLATNGYDVAPESARILASFLIVMLDDIDRRGKHVHFLKHVKE